MIRKLNLFRVIKKGSIRTNLTVVILYIILTMVLTFPLILHMDKYLDLGDPAFNTWVLAWDVHSLTTDPLNLFNTNIFYPLTKNTLAFSEHLIADMLVAFPVIIITHNPILAYNIILFLSFVLSGFGMFLLINYYIKDDYSAFLGGIVFAFCTIRFAHIGHLQLLTAQWMPFALLYLDKFLHKGDSKNLAILYVFYVLQILSCWYHAFYITITLGVYTLCIFMINKDLRRNLFQHSFQIKSILFLICTLAVVAPFAYPYIQVANEYGFTRTLDEVSFYSADVGEYLLTPINNLVYGMPSYPFPANWNFSEHSLFPGITVIMLSLYGIFLLMKLKLDGKNRLALINLSNKMQNIYISIALIAFILSLGYPLHFFGHILNIDLPYKYLFEYLPGFKSMRVPSRFGFIVMLSLSVLAAYGLNRFIESKPKIKKVAISFIFVLLIISESLYIPVFGGTMPVGREIPDVYQWLANESGDFAIVELPSELYSDSKYMYYSIYHWKKLVNGYSGFVPDTYSETMSTLMSFPSNESVGLLKMIGVKYVVIHTKNMDISQWNHTNAAIKDNPNEIRLRKNFGEDYVYEINHSYSNIALSNTRIYGTTGYYAYEDWLGIPTRWMRADGTINVLSAENRTANLSLQAQSFNRNRTLEISTGGAPAAQVAVPTSLINVNVPLQLAKGENTVRLHVPEGCERPCDIKELNSLDSRCLSVAVQNITVA